MRRRDGLALLTLCLCVMLASLGSSIFNVALPAFASALGVSFQSVQWIILSYLLATTTLIVSVGRLGDISGRRRLLVFGISFFVAGSVLGAMGSRFAEIIVARVFQGLGAAVMLATTTALVAEIIPKNKIGSAMGLLGTTSAIGTALGPTIGGVLVSAFTWRAVFLINAPLGIVALLLALHAMPLDKPRVEPGCITLDLPGTALLAVTLGAYALAVTLGRGDFGLLNLAVALLAVLSLGIFIRVQKHSQDPLIQLEVFRDTALLANLLTGVIVSTVLMATLVVGPFYLTIALDLDPATVGMVMSGGPIVAALAGLPSGFIVDRCGAPRMIKMGLGAIAFGCLSLAITPRSLGVPGYLFPIVIVTTGYALFQAANNTAVMKDVPSDRSGVISGLLNLSRNLGLITGTSVMGAVFAFGVGSSDVTSAAPVAVETGMQTAFGVGAALISIALYISSAPNLAARLPR